jgi:hypothetical protein
MQRAFRLSCRSFATAQAGAAAALGSPPRAAPPLPPAVASEPSPAGPAKGQRLSSLLTAARSLPDLRALTFAHGPSLESSQHAIVCVMAARLGGGDAGALVGAHAARWLAGGAGDSAAAQDSLHRARQVANILHAAARAPGVEGAVVARLAADAGARAPYLAPQGAAVCLWALERLRSGDGAALAAVAAAAAREAPRFSPIDVAMALAAVARLLSGGARAAPAAAARAHDRTQRHGAREVGE